MVSLIELPHEILEFILDRVAKPNGSKPPVLRPALQSQPHLHQEREHMQHLLGLRLVHSSFRSILDPYIFSAVECVIERDESGLVLPTGKGLENICSSENLAVHVRDLTVEVRNPLLVTGQGSAITARVKRIMCNTAEQIQCLTISGVGERGPGSGPPSLGLFDFTFRQLSKLDISGNSSRSCLPGIMAAAPLLSTLVLRGPSLGSSGPCANIDSRIVPRKDAKPLELLSISNFGWADVRDLLRALRLSAKRVQLVDATYGWEGTAAEHINALRHLTDDDVCRTFEILFPPKEGDYYISPLDGLRMTELFMQVGEWQRRALHTNLKRMWTGRKVKMVHYVPIQNWRAFAEAMVAKGELPLMPDVMKRRVELS